MRPKMNSRILLALIALIALTAGCKGRVVSLRQAPSPSKPVTVKVKEVHIGDISGNTVYVGSLAASRTATLTAPAPGTLDKLSVREGSKVAKGQSLGKIRSESVESAYKAASSRLAQAEDGLKRAKKVYESGALAEVEYIGIQTKVDEARAAEAAARDARERCSLKTPLSGIVDKVWCVEGEDVSISKPILSIVDLGSIEARFSLPENEYHLYNDGTRASIEIPALQKTLDGRLESKGLVASVLSRSYDCRVSIPKAEGLMPGMVCKVRLKAEDASGTVIPASAVMTDTRGRFVWTATGGVVDKKYITPEGFSGDGIVVSEGLDEGDLVIVSGASKVSTGMKVGIVR